MLVGDVDAFGPALEAAGLGRIVIEPDDVEGAAGGAVGMAAAHAELEEEPAADAAGPLDEGPATGPTAGAEEPSLPGSGRRAGDSGHREHRRAA